jgi:molybdopterin-containing oxidoreductase family membrane subunit
MFHPTMYDIGEYLFTFGFFFTAFLLFAKFFPVINIAEMKSIVKATSERTEGGVGTPVEGGVPRK